MLSNIDDTNPRPSADSHDGAGNVSTGISDADSTSANKNALPFVASRRSPQAGRRSGAETRIANHTAAPITGKCSSTAGYSRLANRFALTVTTRINATTPTRVQSTEIALESPLTIGACACCWRAAINPQTASATAAPAYACSTSIGLTP